MDDLLEGDVELTEFEVIEVESIKGVPAGANGFGHLIMKGLPAEPAVKGARDCPECDKSYDADHQGATCENCGTRLPAAPASKAAGGACKTCGGAGKIMDGNRDCPDCDGPAEKAVGADGQIDEAPDIDTAGKILALIGEAIGSEASEVGAGHPEELGDVQMLARAGEIVACWQAREQAVAAGQDPDAPCGCCEWCCGLGCGCCPGCGSGALMCSAAAKADLSSKQLNDLPDSAFAFIESGGEKDAEGKTTPRELRHFAIHDKAHADAAASRIAGGAKFGDQAKAKVTAAQKKFGESDAGKSVAEGEADVQTDAQGTGSLSKAVEDAVTKAVGPLQERIKVLDEGLAKVLAAPVPGGPVLSNVRASARAEGGDDWAAKAAYYRQKAEVVTDPAERDGYRQLAREAHQKAQAATA